MLRQSWGWKDAGNCTILGKKGKPTSNSITNENSLKREHSIFSSPIAFLTCRWAVTTFCPTCNTAVSRQLLPRPKSCSNAQWIKEHPPARLENSHTTYTISTRRTRLQLTAMQHTGDPKCLATCTQFAGKVCKTAKSNLQTSVQFPISLQPFVTSVFLRKEHGYYRYEAVLPGKDSRTPAWAGWSLSMDFSRPSESDQQKEMQMQQYSCSTFWFSFIFVTP